MNLQNKVIPKASLEDSLIFKKKYPVTPYRFVMVFIFILAAEMNIMMWLTFGPLQTQLKEIYNISLSYATFGTILISSIIFAPSSFLTNYMIDKLGFRFSIIFGTAITAIGMWIRVFCRHGFVYILIGQIIGGTAQSFFYATGQKISAIWFPENERSLATTVVYGFLPVGNAIGSFLPQFFVDPKSRGHQAFNELESLLLFTSYLATGGFALTLIFFKEKPEHPPNKAAAVKRHNFFVSIKEVLKNKNFLIVLGSLSLFETVINGLLPVMQPLVQPYGIDQNVAGNIFSIGVLVTTLLNFVSNYLIGRRKKYKFWIQIFFALEIFSFFLLSFCSNWNQTLIYAIIILVFSVGNGPLPGIYEFLVETSFPVAEEISGTLYSLLYQFISVGLTLWIDEIIEEENIENAQICLLICSIIAIIAFGVFCLAKEDLKRHKFEILNESS